MTPIDVSRVARESAAVQAPDYREHPVALPPIEIALYWHTKFQRDPASRWMRELIARRFGGAAAEPGGAA